MKRLLFLLSFVSYFFLSLLSYVFVDPNLVILNQPWFITWQQSLWAFSKNADSLSLAFLLVTFALVFSYASLLWFFRTAHVKLMPIHMFAAIALVLLLGHNAYSHDIFNYLFNAKMVVQYQANPHVSVALDFPQDEWLRFMHNVHTPAPYGYGWTLVSLLPMALSWGKFLPAYVLMKLLVAAGLLLALFFVWKLLKMAKREHREFWWLVLAFNPLLLLETLLNGHNDVWMMWPALAAWYFAKRKKNFKQLFFIVLLLVFSISIKFATVVLVPLIIIEVVPLPKIKLLQWMRDHWAEFSALALLVPLFTDRSQQFHPWYLIWSLSFLPFIDWKWLRYSLLGLSVSSLFRYYPWIQAGFQYGEAIQLELRYITWSGLLVGVAYWLFETLQKKNVPATKSRRDG